jgi:hypothetical protein
MVGFGGFDKLTAGDAALQNPAVIDRRYRYRPLAIAREGPTAGMAPKLVFYGASPVRQELARFCRIGL